MIVGRPRGARPVRTTGAWRVLVIRVLALTVIFAPACRDSRYHDEAIAQMVGGNPARGPELIRSYGCGTCHTVAGVTGAKGLVGPPLAGIAQRAYIAGVLPNAPENMVRWIENPKAVDPLTAMPVLGVSPADARDIAAYLYTLR
jgi:cytochrome c2